MHIYKFKLTSENFEDFVRYFEISSNSNFEEFHKLILKETNFNGEELASFYISNNRWERLQEITLMDMGNGDSNSDGYSTLQMKDVKLNEAIDDPHQKIIYVYDFLNEYVFHIELLKIMKAEKGVKYPRCIKSEGVIDIKNTRNNLYIYNTEESIIEDNDTYEAVDDEDLENMNFDEEIEGESFYNNENTEEDY